MSRSSSLYVVSSSNSSAVHMTSSLFSSTFLPLFLLYSFSGHSLQRCFVLYGHSPAFHFLHVELFYLVVELGGVLLPSVTNAVSYVCFSASLRFPTSLSACRLWNCRNFNTSGTMRRYRHLALGPDKRILIQWLVIIQADWHMVLVLKFQRVPTQSSSLNK